jgi:L-malate glycosyltransferase
LLLKRRIENIIIFPFILTGRIIARIKPLKKEFRVFYFFPFYHIGGAEKIHAQLAQATGGGDCMIYFTKRSHNDLFLHEFKSAGCVIKDISRFTDNKWLYFLNLIARGVISGYINRQAARPIIFNGQCNFGYKISPWIRPGIPQVELIHALNTFAYIRLPFLSFYKQSLTVSPQIVEKYKTLYTRNNVPEALFHSFLPVMSRIRLPERTMNKDYYRKPFTVLYVGRETPDKRPWIVAEIASRLSGDDIRFELAGEVEQAIAPSLRKYCHFWGDISDEKRLYEIYSDAHILIIPSSSESGPLVFMEAMAKGAAIISTPTGYIPLHIRNGIEGFVTGTIDEKQVISEMCGYILRLKNDRQLLETIGKHNLEYAFNNFSIDSFNKEYKRIFDNLKEPTT